MVLLRVTKCTVFGDNGTDGWGLAPACWGLSTVRFSRKTLPRATATGVHFHSLSFLRSHTTGASSRLPPLAPSQPRSCHLPRRTSAIRLWERRYHNTTFVRPKRHVSWGSPRRRQWQRWWAQNWMTKWMIHQLLQCLCLHAPTPLLIA
jgi:hypothetical protein